MGPYCQYCGSRCFLPRAGAQLGTTTILATCPRGMANDLRKSGYTHRTAINPVLRTRDELADARRLPYGPGRFTLNAMISARVIAALILTGNLTGQAVATLAGIPEAYSPTTRGRLYLVSA